VRIPIVIIAAAAGLAGCSSLTPVNDPVYLRITDVEARLIRIERVLENDSLITLASDISALRNEVQSVLGEVETLRYELGQQGERQQTLYVDLDRRLAELEAAQARLQSMPVAGGAGGGAAAPAVNDQAAYDTAFALIQSQDYPRAQAAFESFLAMYPASRLRDNVQYWLAEMHYVQQSFRTALPAFQKVLDDYPQSAKRPDALLKIGYTNQALGNLSAARDALLEVVRLYPNTDAARYAETRLRTVAGAAD